MTLAPGPVDGQHDAIDRLETALPDGFSVKDSFAALDLAARGFRLLFDADWIWRDAAAIRSRPSAEVPWSRIRTDAELAEWEAAWAANGSPTAMRVFLPAILGDARFALFGRRHRGRIVAGCAANRSARVVGLSNFFSATADVREDRHDAVAEVAGFAPSLPIVGYERGKTLAEMLAVGFRSIGRLQVWLKQGAAHR